jgi:alkylation response protein AidB-like acyl-CoA dehydrogenase
MSRNPMGYGLAVINRLNSAEWIDSLGLRKALEKITYGTSKSGFQAISTVARQFKQLAPAKTPVRMEAPVAKDLFDVSLTQEQEMLRDTLQGFARDVLRPAAHACDEAGEVSAELLAQVQELGLMFYAVPEAFGGAGSERSPVTHMLITETLAQGDLGLTAALLAPMGVATALSHWGTAAQQNRYLPAFVEDKPMVATMAINEPSPLFDCNALSTTARRDGRSFVLNGEKNMVLLVSSAELFLVAAQLEGKGPRLFLVDASTPGLSIRKEAGMGLKATASGRLLIENVRLAEDALLGDDSFDYQAFLNFCRLGWCAAAVGTAQGALEYVIDYCNDRVAFGEPISHRQSVAFMIANIGIELEAMRLMTQRAAARAERGMSFQREAYLARTLCASKAMEIGTNGVQLLGGHGFTKEHPVERWYRDLRVLAVAEGNLHL